MFYAFKNLKIEDYAEMAFGAERTGNPDPTFRGGVFAGKGTPWQRQSAFETPSRARLIDVPCGKIFVRWAHGVVRAGAPTSPPWAAAASGPWWFSDRLADAIVQRTVANKGARLDSSVEARKFGAVAYDWSNLQRVVVCEVTQPIRVLVGVGRPVSSVLPEAARVTTFLDRELQYVLLTMFDVGGKRVFLGDHFLKNLFSGDSTAFTTWWQSESIVKKRRLRA